MTENTKKFLEVASADETLKKELKAANSFDEMAKVAASHGFSIAADDFKATEISEMSEDELKSVAGGSFCSCGTNGSGSANNINCKCTLAGVGEDPTGGRGFCICIAAGLGWN